MKKNGRLRTTLHTKAILMSSVYVRLLVLLISLPCLVHAQAKTRISSNVYKVWIDTGKLTKRAYLVAISDSSIYTSSMAVPFMPDIADKAMYTKINYDQIKMLKVVKKGNAGKGLLAGGLAGIAVGVVAGYAAGDEEYCFVCFTARDKAFLLAGLLGPIGAALGGFIGSKEKIFKIKYEKAKFNEMQAHMLKLVN